MSTPLKDILILGASGSVGTPILTALLSIPTFTITILTRTSSTANFPPHIPLKKVSDAFTVAELTTAFKDQDAVVVALTTSSVTQDDLAVRIIDAAVAAGVKRLIPSEFGTDNLDPRARRLVPIYDAKGRTLEYLIKRAEESDGALTWTSVACGSWLDWGLDPAKSGNFLNIDIKARRATIWDSGLSPFAVTSSANTGLAVAKSLLNPDLTANKQIFLCDFTTNVREILTSLEKQLGEKFIVEEKDSAPALKELRAKYDGGEFAAAFQLLALSFVADVDVGYDFEKEREVWNEKLGLPKVGLDELVKGAIELAKSN